MIAYYAHSHGNGHCNCANLIALANPEETIVFTDSDFCFDEKVRVVKLNDEHSDGTELIHLENTKPDFLHYNPVGMKKIAQRNKKILTYLLANHIELLVVDVSVEVATLARVSSIPYAYIRMQGSRNDLPHLQVYKGASFLIAYYPVQFEDCKVLPWIKAKTLYNGFIHKKPSFSEINVFLKDSFILIIQGRGGNQLTVEKVNKIASLYTNHKVIVIGCPELEVCFWNVENHGIVTNVADYMINAKFIIAACGLNLTSEIIALKRKFLIMPEKRPFDEQLLFAGALERNRMGKIFDSENIKEDVKYIEALEKEEIPEAFITETELVRNQIDHLISKVVYKKTELWK